MRHAVIDQVLKRAELAKSDSDFTYCFALLLAAEALAKTIVLGITAAIGDEKDRNRYRLKHLLVRSDGLGEWGRAIEDALTGPASQYLLVEARTEQSRLAWHMKSRSAIGYEKAKEELRRFLENGPKDEDAEQANTLRLD